MIIHKRTSERYGKPSVYLCNQAFYANFNKSTQIWKKVTCKNCLKQKPKGSGNQNCANKGCGKNWKVWNPETEEYMHYQDCRKDILCPTCTNKEMKK